MLVICNFTAPRRQDQDFWMLRRAYQFVPSHQVHVWAKQRSHASGDSHVERQRDETAHLQSPAHSVQGVTEGSSNCRKSGGWQTGYDTGNPGTPDTTGTSGTAGKDRNAGRNPAPSKGRRSHGPFEVLTLSQSRLPNSYAATPFNSETPRALQRMFHHYLSGLHIVQDGMDFSL